MPDKDPFVEPSSFAVRRPGPFSRRVLRLSPENLLALMAGLIFVAEAFDMLLLNFLPELPLLWEALLDASILILIISPTYFFFYRPFWVEHRRAEEEIRRLSRQLLRAQEKTRKELARDLHDEFGQVLTALQLGIDTLRNSLPPEQPKLSDLCGRLGGLTAELGNHVRSVTAELHPSMLDSLGLVPTLRWHLRQFERQHPELQLELDIADGDRRLPPEIEIALYRICQESLNNVAKHARARRVHLSLEFGEGAATLAIEDDGLGFDIERWQREIAERGGIGLLGMRERSADLGGTFDISSRPGDGTAVRVTIPLTTEETP